MTQSKNYYHTDLLDLNFHPQILPLIQLSPSSSSRQSENVANSAYEKITTTQLHSNNVEVIHCYTTEKTFMTQAIRETECDTFPYSDLNYDLRRRR